MMSLVADGSHEGRPRESLHSGSDAFHCFAPVSDFLVRVGSRRWFLQAGLTAAAGLSLPELLRQRAGAAEQHNSRTPTSVIQIWLSGGPSQIDMWDPKPDMPPEIRGPFDAIPTAIPGIAICEQMPRQAALMDKLAIIRSMDASGSNHWPVTFQAGNRKASRDSGGYPSMGSVAAKFHGPNQPDVPAYVGLPGGTSYPLWYDVYGAGHLGSDYEPVDGARVTGRFSMPEGIAVPRLQDRDRLRQQLDHFKGRLDVSAEFARQDRYTQAAFDLVLGGAAERAFDVSREPDTMRDLYGRDSLGEKALLSRRLIEAGVTYVVLSDRLGSWDHHGDEIPQKGIDQGLRHMLPRTDQVIATLIEDLDQRGLLKTTLVLVVGEFGRAPVLTKTAGRDHWLQVMSLLVAGGGIRGGQTIGATDRRGGEITERPLGPGDLAATVFKHLGINPHDHWLNPAGRPTPLVEVGEPMAELL